MSPPKTRPGFRRAADLFQKLLVELVFRGSADPRADALQLARELADPELEACFERWVVQFEFDRAIAVVAVLGAVALSKPNFVWPAGTAQQQPLVISMTKAILLALVSLGRGPHGDQVRGMVQSLQACEPVDPRNLRPKRPRGRPRTPELDGVCLAVIRERLFAAGRPWRASSLRAVKIMPAKWQFERLYERVKRMAKKEVPIPKRWTKTLLGRRCEPLRGPDPLPVTPALKDWTARERARR